MDSFLQKVLCLCALYTYVVICRICALADLLYSTVSSAPLVVLALSGVNQTVNPRYYPLNCGILCPRWVISGKSLDWQSTKLSVQVRDWKWRCSVICFNLIKKSIQVRLDGCAAPAAVAQPAWSSYHSLGFPAYLYIFVFVLMYLPSLVVTTILSLITSFSNLLLLQPHFHEHRWSSKAPATQPACHLLAQRICICIYSYSVPSLVAHSSFSSLHSTVFPSSFFFFDLIPQFIISHFISMLWMFLI